MRLLSLSLTNFRSYSEASFEFSPAITVVVGPNASGKTNLLESILLLANGSPFSSHRNVDLIHLGESFLRVEGLVWRDDREVSLETAVAASEGGIFEKKFWVDGVTRKRSRFIENLYAVYFGPEEIRLVLGSPARRREYLDRVLCSIDFEYARSLRIYDRVRIQRNRLLEAVRDGRSSGSDLPMWEEKLAKEGRFVTQRRTDLVGELNKSLESLGGLENLRINYRPNEMSLERLESQRRREVAAGTTLIGPHRDEWRFGFNNKEDLALYGSRGQQRLAVTSLKLAEVEVVAAAVGDRPLLLLDDVFSELDEANRQQILKMLPKQQALVTATDPGLVGSSLFSSLETAQIKL